MWCRKRFCESGPVLTGRAKRRRQGQDAGQVVAGRGHRTGPSPIMSYALPLAAGLGLGAWRVWSHPVGELRQGRSELLQPGQL